jgi:hypothetical protein
MGALHAAAFQTGSRTTGAQNNVIWTAEAMIDVGPVFAQHGGYRLSSAAQRELRRVT